MELKQQLQQAAVRIAELEQKLAEAQQAFDAVYALVINEAKSSVSNPDSEEPVSQSNFTDNLLNVLRADPLKSWSYSDIYKQFPDVNINSVSPILVRLRDNGKVVKTGRGLWKAAI